MKLQKGTIIKMDGLSVKKENGVFEIDSPWDHDCSVYKLKKDGTRVKNGLDIFSYKKIEEYGEVITLDQVSAAVTEINKGLKERKDNEIVVSYVSTDKKDYVNKTYIKVIQPIKTTSSIYAIPRNSVFQLSIIETSSNVIWKRVGKRGEVLTSEGTFNLMSWSTKSMLSLIEQGHIEIVERVEQTRKEIEVSEVETTITDQVEKAEEIEEEMKAPEKKIEVKEITFLWSESRQVKDNTTVRTFEEAEQIIFNIAIHKDTGGYDKTKFMITWEDGHTYTGRIDVLSSYTSGKELRKHIENHCLFFAGERKGYHETMEEYENTLRAYGITEEDKKEYRLFLDTYLLEDVSNAPENEIGHIKQERIETLEEVKEVATIENKEESEELVTVKSELNDIENSDQNKTIPISESLAEAQEQLAEITYKLNEEKNGVEIYFSEKPSEEIRNMMKVIGFRWAGKYNASKWYAKQNKDTLSLAKQLSGEEWRKATITVELENHEQKFEYPEIEIDDCADEKYIIPQSVQDREHDANWIFRQNKKDHNKEIQSIFTHYTNEAIKVIEGMENEYYIFKIKSALQSFKKKYHSAYINWLSAKGSQPHWAVSGRGNLSKSRYDKIASRQDKWMLELAGLPDELNKTISYYKNKARKDKENKLKEQLQNELKQPLPELAFKTITKDFDIYGRGTAVKTRFYECEGYMTAKLWGAFRVFDSKGKELWSAKSNGTLKEAKAYISLLVKKDRQQAS